MSQYAEIGNKVMEAITDFPNMDELASEDVDIAFFARMDLTGAILKSIAGVSVFSPEPVVQKLGVAQQEKYFFSSDTNTLWKTHFGKIKTKEPGGKWVDVSEIWTGEYSLENCADVIEITYDDYLDKLSEHPDVLF